MSSVASFFVSRIDTAVDAEITARLSGSTTATDRARLGALRGRVAIANARLAYQRYRAIYASRRWRDLQRLGAQPQRLLWASTSTKNADYRDVVYVEELIGADTVNTIPPATYEAFRDHGEARPGLTENLQAALRTMQMVGEAGMSMERLTTGCWTRGSRCSSMRSTRCWPRSIAAVATFSATIVRNRTGAASGGPSGAQT